MAEYKHIDEEYAKNMKLLDKVFKRVGKGYGYNDVSAEFTDFQEFKVQWSRGYSFAQFRVSDYLCGAPEEAYEGIANTLFAKIAGGEEVPYNKTMREWLLSPDFAKNERPVYLKRATNLITKAKGNQIDLKDSWERLKDMGLIDPEEDIFLCWTTKPGRAACSSLLMRVISLSTKLDDTIVPDYVRDYALYTQYLKIVKGARVFGFVTEVYTRDEERKFEKYKEAEKFLNKIDLYL